MHPNADPGRRLLPAGRCVAALFCLLVACRSISALDYLRNDALAAKLRTFAEGREAFVRLRSLVDTAQSNGVWLVELGQGTDEERARRPALLVVAGLEGNDLAGTVSVVAWLDHLVRSHETNEATRKLLETTTLYLLPRVSADAAERFFTRPRMESGVNNQPVDDDHDGLVDEDGPDDLNGDGLITWMRVKDAEGDEMPDPAEPRLLVKADRTKGEVGAWRQLSEGRDNDGDEAWNEDGPGGVNFNRNFPCNYRFFAPGSGRHQVSEPETRALADFVVAHPNIAVAFTFGAADNLVQTPKAEPPKRPPTAIHEADAGYFRELGRAWRDALGLKKELQGTGESGTFSDWMYLHRGRLSLAARPWTPALQLELAKGNAKGEEAKPKVEAAEERKEPRPAADAKDTRSAGTPPRPEKSALKPAEKPEARNEEERAFLKWADANAPELFVPWKAVPHPDFPGQTVEVGGWAPFAWTNPPEKFLDGLALSQAKFLTDLAGRLPRLGIRRVKVKPLGESVFDVTVQIENTGYLPTALAQGEVSREVAPTRVVLNLDDKAILSGTRRVMVGPIPGSGGMKEVRWVILAKGVDGVTVEIVSALAGTVRKSIELKESSRP